MRIHFIQQEAWVEPGGFLHWALQNGHEISRTRCWRLERVPKEPEADMLVVLGGTMSPSTTWEECPGFDTQAQQSLIRKYAEAGKPVVGSCLGAQLIGEALGAPFEHSPEVEVGPVRAWLTEAGREDPFLRGFPYVFAAGAWHHDMPGLTGSAVVLAESEGCPRQIVRYGKYVYAFQAHMEFTHEIVAAGLEEMDWEVPETGRWVQTTKQLLTYDYTEMNRLLGTFLDAITEDWLTQSDDRA